MTDVVDGIFAVDPDDQAGVAVTDYSWSAPLDVVDVDETEWDVPRGEDWTTREVVVETSRGTRFVAAAVDDQDGAVELDHADRGPTRGTLVEFGPVDGDQDDSDEAIDRPEWLQRDADEIVETSSVSRDLEEVLDAVEQANDLLDVHKRIAGGTMSTTKSLLWELGLRDQTGQLLPIDERRDRIEEIREVYVR